METGRSTGGNMTVLVAFSIGLIVCLWLVGFTFNAFLNRAFDSQHDADRIALTMARDINAGNRVGQMNALEECSRELVFVSRENQQDCNEDPDMQTLAPLYQQLVDEARAGQALVEHERQNQNHVITTELQQAADKYNSAAVRRGAFCIFWLQTQPTFISRVDIGHPRIVESGVQAVSAIENLADFDRRKNYVDVPSGLFKGSVNAKLPAPDHGLDFKLTHLPAFIDGTYSPSRNANPESFVPTATIFDKGRATKSLADYIPTAVQVFCTMDAQLSGKEQQHADVKMVSTAITNGALRNSQ